MSKKTLYTIATLCFLAFMVYLSDSPETILGPYNHLETEVDKAPFSVVKKATTKVFEKDGTLSYSFHADKLEHYQEHGNTRDDNVFTLVENPFLEIHQGQEPWEVSAEKGKMTTANQQIDLWNNVLLKHTSAESIYTQVSTEKLTIDPNAKLANTEEPVKILSDKIELEGVGMNADLCSEKIKLQKNVHGLHDPS